jgi:hypothetical protein
MARGAAMNITRIDEPVSVLARCSGGTMEPLRFRRAGRDYRVEAVNGRWIDRSGDGCSLHFSVQVGNETFLMHFAVGEVQWWLDEVAVP